MTCQYKNFTFFSTESPEKMYRNFFFCIKNSNYVTNFVKKFNWIFRTFCKNWRVEKKFHGFPVTYLIKRVNWRFDLEIDADSNLCVSVSISASNKSWDLLGKIYCFFIQFFCVDVAGDGNWLIFMLSEIFKARVFFNLDLGSSIKGLLDNFKIMIPKL